MITRLFFSQILMISVLFLSSCSKDSSPIEILSVSFTMDKTNAEVGETITFTNTSKYGTSYEWDFGDGNSSTENNPSHIYANAEKFSVTLTASGEEGSEAKTKPVMIWDLLLESTFYEDSVKFQGPTDFLTQPVKLIFYNQSLSSASANLVKHDDGYSHQNMLDLFTNGISYAHHPNWTDEISGVYHPVDVNDNHIWVGNLEPGLYTLVSARIDLLVVWYVADLTVNSE